MIKLGRAYVHKKGKEVLTQEFVKIKIDGEWVEGIKYGEGKVDRYVRTIPDFIENFELIA